MPTLPWSGSDLIAPMLHPSGKPEGSKKRAKVSRDLYRKGCANTLEEGLSSSQKIGYPVMIKASEGGGGKGIRKAESAEEFPKQYAQVSLPFFPFWPFLALFGPFTESAQVSAIIFDCETFNNFFTYVAKTLVNLKNRRIAMAPLFLRLILLKKSSQINQKSFQLEFFIIFLTILALLSKVQIF